ncbi:EspA/EspE family type VII secretion system effector [Mycobacterium marinum]|uniref:EspA/EspE family type VII secretion system effector n=1 Tax=Mycobacterium marinum TaxID=1781 RepID=UPI00235932A0|nr:EspA/EspE family type VII secretion system effector [Mycobacterium marinum]MDC8985542.1 EspA/EspE family type VII secretion system effector [Mycobacterium marinum]MDC9002843.1 EspA/EspE family type VII secretion system effector [Mycobacterium marinum]MDC9013579.1 EspA/EspE family type VII secretion system effector [Mycobacterium marinum]MDC9018939.1 EspA/EspE family type VII secretion system effector [Mycobacterium marinum]
MGTESFLLWVLLGLLGDGDPERGDRLEGSAAMFDDLAVRVAAFDPHAGWRGGAAHAYGACTRAQSQHATLIADLDRLTAQLMSSQAQAVKDTRKGVSVEIGLVGIILLVCIGLESTGQPWAEAASFYIALVIAGGSVALTILALFNLRDTTSRNANDMQAVAQRGSDLVAALPAGSRAALGCPAPASPDAGVSRFALADHTAPSPLTVELGSALAGLPGAPQFHLATDAGAGLADFGAPGLPIPPLTGMPTPPDLPGVSDLPDVFGLPTIASLSTTLGQLSSLAGPTNAARQPANTAPSARTDDRHSGPPRRPTTRDPGRPPRPAHTTTNPDIAGAARATTNHHRPPRTHRHSNPAPPKAPKALRQTHPEDDSVSLTT